MGACELPLFNLVTLARLQKNIATSNEQTINLC